MDNEWRSIEAKRVMVLMTARDRGAPARRLPDREDADGVLAAIQIESEADAREVLAALDAPDRIIYVDVERKQSPDLMGLALDLCPKATIRWCKPNDTIVAATIALLGKLRGDNLSGLRIGIVGLGNIGFKLALSLAETGAQVYGHDIESSRTAQLLAAINVVRPRYTTYRAQVWGQEQVDVLISAASAPGVVGPSMLPRLAPGAHVIDVGIDNLTGEFVSRAMAAGHSLTRADIRAASESVPGANDDFFESVMGTAQIAGHKVAAGGVMAPRGTVVVDRRINPTRAFGVATGRGGLVAADQLTDEERKAQSDVESEISGS